MFTTVAQDDRMAQPAKDAGDAHNPFNSRNIQNAGHLLFALQIFLIILFARCSRFQYIDASSAGYFYFSGVEVMMFVGFGYLMTFLKTYGVGAVGLTMLVTAVGLQWYLFTQSFFQQIYENYNYPDKQSWKYTEVNIYNMMNALFGVSAVLISFGAVIGKIKPLQLVIMTILELVFHAFNAFVVLEGSVKLADVGGTYPDHMFGAYFGLTVAMVLHSNQATSSQRVDPTMGYVADILSLIGTVFLWIYWPSFVAGGAEVDSHGQQRAVLNTILSLSASTMMTFYLSTMFNKEFKFRPVDIQNATLAGGVAIGCSANFNMNPVNAVFIGCAAGAISTFGFNYIQPFLFRTINLHDTCGIHNLHGMPSLIGGLASVIIAGYQQAEKRDHDGEIFTTGQWWRQLVAIGLCLLTAIVSGFFTGWVCRLVDPITEADQPFDDHTVWEVAPDFADLKMSKKDIESKHQEVEMVVANQA